MATINIHGLDAQQYAALGLPESAAGSNRWKTLTTPTDVVVFFDPISRRRRIEELERGLQVAP